MDQPVLATNAVWSFAPSRAPVSEPLHNKREEPPEVSLFMTFLVPEHSVYAVRHITTVLLIV
jgi:hypothetical protein